MDTNRNGITGESVVDRFTLTTTYTPTIGPEGTGYMAAAYPYEDIDLSDGDPDVVSVLPGSDDGAAFMDLGSNTFTLYGTQYTGTQLLASSNGLIAALNVPVGTASYSNNDLTTSPPQRMLAVLWDDWIAYPGPPAALPCSAL